MTVDLKLLKMDNRLANLISKGETKNMRLINKVKRKRRAYLKSIGKE